MAIIEDFFCFEDIETTGLVKGHDEVTEISTILTDLDFREISRFDAKIQFDHNKMTPEVAKINGYDPKVWAFEARPFYEWQAWLDKHVPYPHVAMPVGHNVDFDYGIISERYYKPVGKFFRWSYHKIDTVGISLLLRAAKIINVPDVKLDTVCDALKIVSVGSHRAGPDMMKMRGIFDFAVGVLKS